MDEFSENPRRAGGGSFPIQNKSLQILCIINENFGHAFPEKSAMKNSETRGGGRGSKAVWNFSGNSSILASPSVPN